jgi:hypothetical protein
VRNRQAKTWRLSRTIRRAGLFRNRRVTRSLGEGPTVKPSDLGDRIYFVKVDDSVEKREPQRHYGSGAIERDTKCFPELVHKDMFNNLAPTPSPPTCRTSVPKC